jgi:hypothetical protein
MQNETTTQQIGSTQHQPVAQTGTDQHAAADKIEACFKSWGEAMMGLLNNQKEMADKLNELIRDRAAHVDLSGKHQAFIENLVQLQADDRKAIEGLQAMLLPKKGELPN